MSSRLDFPDLVPEDATDEQLVEMFGAGAGYEVVAMRALQVQIGQGDLDDDGRIKVGPNYYDWAVGKIDGRELCEREGLAGFRAEPTEEDQMSEQDEQDGATHAEGEAGNAGQLPPPDPELGELANEEAAQGRRDLLAALSSGELELNGIFTAAAEERAGNADHRVAGHTHIRAALLALPGVGEVKADRILESVGIEGDRHIDSIGSDQAAALNQAVAEEAGNDG